MMLHIQILRTDKNAYCIAAKKGVGAVCERFVYEYRMVSRIWFSNSMYIRAFELDLLEEICTLLEVDITNVTNDPPKGSAQFMKQIDDVH